MLSALEKAKAAGARVISVNPLPEAGLERFKNPQTPQGMIKGTALNDLFLQIRIGGDQALFRLLNKMILETEGAVDDTFVTEHTHGYEEFAAAARAADWDETLTATGLDRATIEQALTMVLASKRTIVCWAMGLTQHKHSVATIREVVNFLLLRGNIGRPGAGVCPVRATQRPGRPHHGHLRTPRTRIPRRPRQGIRHHLTAPPRLRRRPLHPGPARR